jgi:hypothetical protein
MKIGIDERGNSAAQRLIRLEVSCFEDLETDFEILIANEKRGTLLIAIA